MQCFGIIYSLTLIKQLSLNIYYFELDKKKQFKALTNLDQSYFKFQDSYIKMKAKVVATQLSSSVASEINTHVLYGIPQLNCAA